MPEIPTYWLISYTWRSNLDRDQIKNTSVTFWEGSVVDWIIKCHNLGDIHYHLTFAIEISGPEYDRGRTALSD